MVLHLQYNVKRGIPYGRLTDVSHLSERVGESPDRSDRLHGNVGECGGCPQRRPRIATPWRARLSHNDSRDLIVRGRNAVSWIRAMTFSEVAIDDPRIEEWIHYPYFVFEQKMDGFRVLTEWTPQTSMFYRANGEIFRYAAATQHLPSVSAALNAVVENSTHVVLDGELMVRTGEYLLFDILLSEGTSAYSAGLTTPYGERRNVLERLFPSDRVLGTPLAVIPSAYSPSVKRRLLEQVRDAGEGIVIKDLRGLYEPGQRVRHVKKLKFVKTADVVVTEVRGSGGVATSFAYGVISPWGYSSGPSGEGKGDVLIDSDDGLVMFQELGRCAVADRSPVKVGNVIEIAYLYREPRSGGIVQARMLRIREDKAPRDCTIDQFPKYSREMRHISGD